MPKPTDLDDLADTVESLQQAKREIAKWRDVEEAAASRIKERMLADSADEGALDGHTVVTWHAAERTDLDVKRLRRELGDAVLAPYMRTSVVRRLLVEF